MKTVVITGSAGGFGLELAKQFKSKNCNVVLSDINQQKLQSAVLELEKIQSDGKVASQVADVTDFLQLQSLWDFAKTNFENVDIWINNAGVNQPDKPVFELKSEEISFLLDIDLKGAIFGSSVAFAGMKQQDFGQIYNVEGYGSNNAKMLGLSIYGTSKRAVTYFCEALAKESKILTGGKVCICKLTPGIMITDFIKTANGGKTKINLPQKTKKVYNILGDYPGTIASYCVPKMLANNKNGYKIAWLTNARAFWRFLTAGIKKRNFFED